MNPREREKEREEERESKRLGTRVAFYFQKSAAVPEGACQRGASSWLFFHVTDIFPGNVPLVCSKLTLVNGGRSSENPLAMKEKGRRFCFQFVVIPIPPLI